MCFLKCVIMYQFARYSLIMYWLWMNLLLVLRKVKHKRSMFNSSNSGKAAGFPCRGRGEQLFVDDQVQN